MTEEERRDKLALNLLPCGDWSPLKRESDNNLTWLQATDLYFKLGRKFFNQGTQRESEEKFVVWSKQLSKLLSGWHYLGGKDKKEDALKKPKRKYLRSSMAIKSPNDKDNNAVGQQLVWAPQPQWGCPPHNHPRHFINFVNMSSHRNYRTVTSSPIIWW